MLDNLWLEFLRDGKYFLIRETGRDFWLDTGKTGNYREKGNLNNKYQVAKKFILHKNYILKFSLRKTSIKFCFTVKSLKETKLYLRIWTLDIK